ncbi:MAG: hypothetical protein Q9184_000989 [Pyrenodesmia sp. 2 TL-2023]
MSTPRTAEEVFNAIEHEMDRLGVYYRSMADISAYIDEQLAEAKNKYPFMQGKTHKDYSIHQGLRMHARFRVEETAPIPTSKDFWAAAYEYNPDEASSAGNSRLEKIIGSTRLGPITIGSLWGRTTLRLLPGLGSLPAQDIEQDIHLRYAPTRTGAISYPDGHPSEEELVLTVVSEAGGPPTVKAKPQPVITAREDNILRRFASLGWVIMEASNGDWIKTGHVLVIDMDERHVRHRQPWLVLASQWPTDGEETPASEFTWYADETVDRGDKEQPGVFPGDRNRTPICRIRPLRGEKPEEGPVLKQLGEHFDFEPVRYGGTRHWKESQLGPGLAHVMDWYWDPKKDQEVCYSKDGVAYMRYKPFTKEYSYPSFSRMSFAGQQGMFGELVEGEPSLVAGPTISFPLLGGPPLSASSEPRPMPSQSARQWTSSGLSVRPRKRSERSTSGF